MVTLTSARKRPAQFENSMVTELKKLTDAGVVRISKRQGDEENDEKCLKLNTRWVFTETDIDNPEKSMLKGRLVVQGHLHDVQNTCECPTTHKDSAKLLCHLAASKGWDIAALDVKRAFLQAKTADSPECDREQRRVVLEKPRVMPDGIQIGDDEVLEIVTDRTLYGLKTAPLPWWNSLSKELRGLGYVQSEYDLCLFIRKDKNGEIISALATHVDDLFFVGSSEERERLIRLIPFEFGTLKLNEFVYCGMQYKREVNGEITVSMRNYSDMIERVTLRKGRDPETELTQEEIKRVRSVIGQLSWYAYKCRPEISYMVNLAARNFSKVKGALLCNKILRTIESLRTQHGESQMVFKCVSGENDVICIVDASPGSTEASDRATTGIVLIATEAKSDFLQNRIGNLMKFSTKAQAKSAKSSKVAELVAASAGHGELEDLCAKMLELGVKIRKRILCTDNDALFENIYSNNPKMLEIRYMPHLRALREWCNPRLDAPAENAVLWIPDRHNLADILTKMPTKTNIQNMIDYMKTNLLILDMCHPHKVTSSI